MFLAMGAVSDAVPGRSAERAVQVEADNRLDVQRGGQRGDHLLLLRCGPRAPGFQKRRTSGQPRLFRRHNVHVRGLGGQLPDGALHQLLHSNPARVRVGEHSRLVPLHACVRRHHSRDIHERVQSICRGSGGCAFLLAVDFLRRGGDPRPVLDVRCASYEVLPYVPWDDPVDEVRRAVRGSRILSDGEAEVA